MNARKVPFEHICPIEKFCCRRTTGRAEPTDHDALVMREGVPILIIFPCKSFCVIIACLDWTFFHSVVLVCKHVSFQVFEDFSAFGICAATLFFRFLVFRCFTTGIEGQRERDRKAKRKQVATRIAGFHRGSNNTGLEKAGRGHRIGKSRKKDDEDATRFDDI